MQYLSMKQAVGVAVVAAIVGAATVGIGVEQVQDRWRPVAAVAVVAFVAYCLLKMLQIMKLLQYQTKWIGEKCSYMEKRMDAAAAKSSDVCRHLQQVFVEFDADKNGGKNEEMKFWWVERRLRAVYEDFSNCRAMEKCSFEMVKKTWSMLQLEVKLRSLRDVVAWKHFGGHHEGEVHDMEHCLKNMEIAARICTFWQPMKLNELQQHEAQSCFEEILITQIGERVKELMDHLEGDDLQKYAGLNLEGIIGSSSSS